MIIINEKYKKMKNKITKMITVGEIVIEFFLTYLGLLDIYTDFAFITIAYKEGLIEHFVLSLFFFVLTILPKLYSYGLILKILDGKADSEDKRRKFAFRAFTFTEFRVQALNVDYILYEKMRTEC